MRIIQQNFCNDLIGKKQVLLLYTCAFLSLFEEIPQIGGNQMAVSAGQSSSEAKFQNKELLKKLLLAQ